VGDPALDLTAGVCLSTRLASLLAPQWRQRPPGPYTARSSEGLDLVVLEVSEGRVPGWGPDCEALAEAVQHWVTAEVPVLAWCTSGDLRGLPWTGGLTGVAVTSPDQQEAVRQQHERVVLLPPAAQPRVHRPGPEYSRRRGARVILDGLSALTDDRALTEVLAPALRPLPAQDVRIEQVGVPDAPRPAVPPSLADRHVAGAPWPELETSLGQSRVALDLSGTCAQAAWTTVACAAAGTALVGASTLSEDLAREFGATVPDSQDARELRSELVARIHQEELAAREGHRLRRAVLEAHTAGHRVRSLAREAGLRVPEVPRSVSAVVPTNRAPAIGTILENLSRQAHRDRELVLVLHGLDVSTADVRSRAAEVGVDDLVVVHADASLTLGACMNLGVQASSGRYIAKMDDDNFYGEHYLTDLVHAFGYTGAGIVGKWCHYVWLRSSGAVVLRYPDSEHAPERRIQGGSMLFDADVVRTVRFADLPRAVDSDILDRAAAEGVHIYSADRFNFVSVRGADRHAHTWTVADSTFLTRTGRLLFYGDPRPHVSV